MRAHPIPPVTEPLQFRAIGLVRGTYTPTDPDQVTRGVLTDSNGLELETVVLGRVLTLMRRHLAMDQPHLWVVYPRCRDSEHLHLQIAGVWEPSTLAPDQNDGDDTLPQGDDYFSIRGELIYTKPETGEMVVKVRQLPRPDGKRPLPFKVSIKGELPLEHLRHFVSLDLRRQGQELHLEQHEVIAPMPTRGGKSKGGRGAATSPQSSVMAEQGQGSTSTLRAGLVVAGITGLGAFGPAMGLSSAWIVVFVLGGLIAFSVDAASWQGMGGHILAEALPGGQERLRRIAVHEAGHLLIAETEALPVQRVLVGTLACVQSRFGEQRSHRIRCS